MYTNEHAIDVLYESALSLHSAQETREFICTFVRDNCWEGDTADRLLEAAIKDNFDPADVQEDALGSSPNQKVDSRSSGGATSSIASAALHRPREVPRHLRRTDTDEEFERLKKNRKCTS